ncbi:MAG: hypothetical protein NT150_00300 [Bacteroidetes bacterium]|nr:hypothetical protein [Bacteroidota bacterium]
MFTERLEKKPPVINNRQLILKQKDMKSKSNLDTAIIMTVLVVFTSLGNLRAQIANSYPYDSLINNDPNVIFSEMFEQSSINTMISSSTYQTSQMLSHINFELATKNGTKS